MEITEFIYTEKIFNTISHTAQFVSEETYQKGFCQLLNKRNCFHSAFLFSKEILSYVKENLKDGKPSVKGYPGPCYSKLLRTDFDGNGDLEPVRRHIQKIAEAIIQTFQIPKDSMRYAFTGKKGFNLEIPSIFFDAKPDQRFNEITEKVINNLLLNDSEFLDPSAYEKVRFWRTINSIHGGTGLYKIPLSYRELGEFTADKIKELAQGERKIPSLAKATPIPILVEAWNEAREEVYSSPVIQRPAIDITEPPHDAKICYWKALNEGVEERNPGRHMWGLRIAKYLRQDLGFSPDVAKSCFIQWNRKNRPPLDLSEKEVDRFISDGLIYDFGCNDEVLKSKCDQECRYYKKPVVEIKQRGWGKNLFEILDTPEEASTPLIEGILYEGDRGYITSTYKLGKTLFLTHVSLSLATATPFLGFNIPKARKVLYIRFELKEERFRKRLVLMLPALGGREAVEKYPVFHLTRGFHITQPKDFEWLVQMIYKHEPDILFLDPFYKLTFLDLKETASAMPIIQKFDILTSKFPSLNISIAHHLRKQSGGQKDNSWDASYGPMQFFADMDYEIRLTSKRGQKDTFEFSHISNDVSIGKFTFKRNPSNLLYELEPTRNVHDRTMRNVNERIVSDYPEIARQVQQGLNKKGTLTTFLQNKLGYSQRDAKACLEHLLKSGKLTWMGPKTHGVFKVPGSNGEDAR